MNNEETKQVWDNLFQKLNEKEKTFLAVVNNEKNKEIEKLNKSLEEQRHFYLKKLEQKDNIIREIEDMLENPWNIDCINQNNNYLHKLQELKGSDESEK